MTSRVSSVVGWLLTVVLLSAAAVPVPVAPASPAGRALQNPDFESGDVGQVPVGWTVSSSPGAADYRALISTKRPRSGARSALLSGARDDAVAHGELSQSFSVAAHRGHVVRLRAAVRVEARGPASGARFWLELASGEQTLLREHTLPISGDEWREYQLVVPVPASADRGRVGLTFYGAGEAFLDDVAFEVLGKVGIGNQPPRPLASRALANLVAFARIYGYVRYFHPSDEAASASWDAIAIDGVAAVEDARDPAELAQRLSSFFGPVAPTVEVFVTNARSRPAMGAAAREKGRLIRWEHHGLGLESRLKRSPYVSVRAVEPGFFGRVVARLRGESSPDPRKPGHPFSADLPGGVSCHVPLALAVRDGTTLPRATGSLPRAVRSKPAGFLASVDDRATRLAGVIVAWNALQHFYPYFDVIKVDWYAMLARSLSAAATDEGSLAFQRTLRRLVAALEDGHGWVSIRETPRKAHLPPLLWDLVEDKLVITRTAASKTAVPIRIGDEVVSIDGRPASLVLAEEEALTSGATSERRRLLALQELLLGEKDSPMSLGIRAPGANPRTVALRRTIAVADFDEPRPGKVAELRPGVFYLDLGRISDADFQAVLPRLATAAGIVFDFRGYPNHLAFDFAPLQHLIDKPVSGPQLAVPHIRYPDRWSVEFGQSDWTFTPLAPRLKARVAFVTDASAISRSELYLGVIEHHRLAHIVGQPTAGTNGNVNFVTIPGGITINFTGMRVLKPDGSRHHGVGIQPTVSVRRTLKGVIEQRDELLERALAIVSAPPN